MCTALRGNYVGYMGTNTVNPIRGSTASCAVPAPRRPPAGRLPHHRLGSALRAVGVFADTAFRVVVLGADGTRQPDPPRDIPPQGAGRS
jgi:hypothetical protein